LAYIYTINEQQRAMNAPTFPAHLTAENILRAFNKNMSDKEVAERAKLMRDPMCTSRRITNINRKWSK
jgi:hypothetical protein